MPGREYRLARIACLNGGRTLLAGNEPGLAGLIQRVACVNKS